MSRAMSVLAVFVCASLVAAASWSVYSAPDSIIEGGGLRDIAPFEGGGGDPVLLTVEQGASAEDIGGLLAQNGVIRSGRLFEVLVGLTGLQNSLEAGEYEFERGTPAIEVVHRIAEGRTASRQVTIQEGLRSEEIGDILEREGIISKQQFLDALAGPYNEPFLAQIDVSGLEGFLFPAGYEFTRVVAADQVVATMLRGFQTNVADGLPLEGQDLTLAELVTLASIVQREAAVIEEMPVIASVFLNRLRLDIPLQADPTVQYALAQDPANIAQFGYWKEGITLDDLQFDSPYNTYVYPGLPPGPIANPGLDALSAVIRPADTQYLYFVAKGDESGEHVFAETLEQHLQNVAEQQQ